MGGFTLVLRKMITLYSIVMLVVHSNKGDSLHPVNKELKTTNQETHSTVSVITTAIIALMKR